MTWRNNVAEDNLGRGLWCDWICLNNTIVSNIARYNTSFGILYEASGTALIASNVLAHNNDAGINLIDSSNVRVWNNTFDANASGIQVPQDSRRTGDANASGVVSNVTLSNNLFANGTIAGAAFFNADDYTHQITGSQMIASADYDGFYRANATIPKYIAAWSNGTGGGDNLYLTLAAFQQATGNEAHGLAVDNQPAAPLFVNEAAGNYALAAGSLATGAGQPLPSDVATAIGVVPGVSVNLGALVWPAS